MVNFQINLFNIIIINSLSIYLIKRSCDNRLLIYLIKRSGNNRLSL